MRTALSLGGNIGNPKDYFAQAVKQLKQAGMTAIKTSSFYATPPVGCAPGTTDFINAALTGNWPESLESLFKHCKAIEESLGRPANHPRRSDRTIDLDIIFFDDIITQTSNITIPHKEAYNRLFVLIPLAEVAGNWIFPGKGSTVTQILANYTDSSDYQAIITGKTAWTAQDNT